MAKLFIGRGCELQTGHIVLQTKYGFILIYLDYQKFAPDSYQNKPYKLNPG